MDVWNTRKGRKAKCKQCNKIWYIKNLRPERRNPDYQQKRSLKNLDSVTASITRERLLEMISACDDLRLQAFVATLFITGSRIQEITNYKSKTGKIKGVKKFNFIHGTYKGSPVFWVKGLRLLKTRDVRPAVRPDLPISYKKDSGFIYYIKQYIAHLEPNQPLFDFSHQFGRKLLGDNFDIFPHLLRDLRYYDLGETYGWDMGKRHEFFGWKTFETARNYLKIRPEELITKDIY